jgi:hypothetical protein
VSERPHKEAYEKPQVLRVKLVQGEMAVTGCKTRQQATGPAFPGCRAGICQQRGS